MPALVRGLPPHTGGDQTTLASSRSYRWGVPQPRSGRRSGK